MSRQHSGTFYDSSSPASPTSPTSPWQANTSAPLEPATATGTASGPFHLRRSSSSHSSSILHPDSPAPSLPRRAEHRQSGQSFQPTIAASLHSTLSGSTVAPAESGPAQHRVYWEGYAVHEANRPPHVYAEYAAQQAAERGSPPAAWVENMDPNNPSGGTLYAFFHPDPIRGVDEAIDYLTRYDQVRARYEALPRDVNGAHLLSELSRLVDPYAPPSGTTTTLNYWTNAMTRLDRFTRNMNEAVSERNERVRLENAARRADERRREEVQRQQQQQEQQPREAQESNSRGLLRRMASSLTIRGSSSSSKKNKRKKEHSLGTRHDRREPFATMSSRTAARYQI